MYGNDFEGFVSAYMPKRRLSIAFPERGMTKQSFKAECDINNIVNKYASTGVLTHVNEGTPSYGDFSPVDFLDSMNLVISAQAAFDGLPSSLRRRFGNDPYELLSFLANDENREEAIKLGLIASPEPSKGDSPSARVVGDLPPSDASAGLSGDVSPPA